MRVLGHSELNLKRTFCKWSLPLYLTIRSIETLLLIGDPQLLRTPIRGVLTTILPVNFVHKDFESVGWSHIHCYKS